MKTLKSNTDDLVQTLMSSESIMLSIVIISKGLISKSLSQSSNLESKKNLESKENIAILNITHTDSYTQYLKNRIESLYELMGSKLIFPLGIWKNNLKKTKQSTGNINRQIYNDIDQIRNLRVNVMIDNIKQNIPKYNYVMEHKIIESLTQGMNNMGLEQVYLSKWVDCFKFNDFDKLTEHIENKYKIKNINMIKDTINGLGKNQIQYLRQYGIEQQNNKKYNRKRKIHDIESEIIQIEQNEQIEQIELTEQIEQNEQIEQIKLIEQNEQIEQIKLIEQNEQIKLIEQNEQIELIEQNEQIEHDEIIE